MGLGKYPDLSHPAKETGGPEKGIRAINAYKPLVLSTVVLLPLAVNGTIDIVRKVNHKIKQNKKR